MQLSMHLYPFLSLSRPRRYGLGPGKCGKALYTFDFGYPAVVTTPYNHFKFIFFFHDCSTQLLLELQAAFLTDHVISMQGLFVRPYSAVQERCEARKSTRCSYP